jgi:hypothetical protein
MDKKTNNKNLTWDEVEKESFTPEEIAAGARYFPEKTCLCTVSRRT